jgi:hypothetical protein
VKKHSDYEIRHKKLIEYDIRSVYSLADSSQLFYCYQRLSYEYQTMEPVPPDPLSLPLNYQDIASFLLLLQYKQSSSSSFPHLLKYLSIEKEKRKKPHYRNNGAELGINPCFDRFTQFSV